MLKCFVGTVGIGGGDPVRLMAVMNASPESFFSHSFVPREKLRDTAFRFLDDGAEIIDLGARSTAPDAPPLSAAEEKERLCASLKELAGIGLPVSVDTMFPDVLDAALRYDIDAINDIHGLANPDYARIAGDAGLPVFLMASTAVPGDAVGVTATHAACETVIDRAHRAGITDIILDPAIGHWIPERTMEDDWDLCRAFSSFQAHGCPLLAAVSRKSFIGDLLDTPPEGRLAGTMAVTYDLLLQGASVVRTHDVRETADLIRIFEHLRESRQNIT
ncbi:dihydropteroate synthase [Methanomicrobiaceae archaeon CYW5]|uniref:dihydropteroate synthase n=1 Tax=Methanovulcanius yangii TaxID=1789227 RepID=UPI0029CA072F|nr:dihydropteroate synthase [Methanovulcanius yangii]MBT8507510.1 dihydropteroate synthase [Methanovulcanius yangii]